MAFPQTPLDVVVELYLNGAWVDVTGDVYVRDRIQLNRGRDDQASRVGPSRCRLTLDNRDGTYSPRNPSSPYYGYLGRGTPLRVSVGDSVRFTGEVVSWPQRWDVAGVDVITPIEAAGIMRRLGQGVPSIQSTVSRYLPATDPDVYWPLTDPDGATSGAPLIGSTIAGHLVPEGAVTTTPPPPQGWGRGVLAPWLEPTVQRHTETASLLPSLLATVAFTSGSTWTVDYMAAATRGFRVSIYTNNNYPYYRWAIHYSKAVSSLAVTYFYPPLTTDVDSVTMPEIMDGRMRHYRLTVSIGAASITADYTLWVDGDVVVSGTFVNANAGRPDTVELEDLYLSTDTGTVLIEGHVALWLTTTPPPIADAVAAAFGYSGETAGRRMERLCLEEAIPFGSLYDLDSTVLVGPQRSGLVLDLLFDAADADGGVLHEPRQVVHAVGDFDTGSLDGWTVAGSVPPTLALSTTRAVSGITSALITWGSGGVLPLVQRGPLPFTFTPGFEYTATVQVWVPTGSPDVVLVNAGLGFGSTVTAKDQWAESVLTFVATSTDHTLQIWPTTGPTAGNQCWFDAVRLSTDRSGLAYRTRASRENQTAQLTIDYAAGQLSPPLELAEDDTAIVNDVTVQRRYGSSARATLDTGSLSTQPPPDGVGRYDQSVTLALNADTQAPDHAGWRLHLGTWDAARYPRIHVDLGAVPALTTAAAAVDVGDRLVISNPPAWLPPGSIDVQAEGYQETLDAYGWDLEFNASPGGPWAVGVVEDDTLGRLETTGAELHLPITSGATTFTVTTTSGPIWTADAADFPLSIRCGGEQMTVTDIDAPAITFVAAGTVAHGVNASVAPGLPAGATAGDLLLVFAAIRNSGAGTPTAPSGYTTLVDASNMRLFGKTHSGTESAPTVAFSGGVANADTSAQMAAFRGVSLLNLIGTVTGLNASGQNIDIPALNLQPSITAALVLHLGWKQDDWTSVAPVANGTEIGEPDTTTGDDQGITWNYRIITPTTPFNVIAARVFTVTGGAAAISRGACAVFTPQVQLFTATRSVNGVTKAHAAGSAVSLWTPARLALS